MPSKPKAPSPRGLRVIALLKLLKAAALFGISFGLFRLINHDLGEAMRDLTFRFRIDPENTIVRRIIEKVARTDPRTLRHAGWFSLGFAVDLVVESVGLWLNQTWAKYLVLVATLVGIPLEVYAVTQRFDWERALLLIVNLSMAVYIGWLVLCRERKSG
jgi:uncharacterized membrane protein (DUF2068 family)